MVSYDSDATDELKIYVDGTLAGQHDQFGGLVSNSHESPFAIGISRPGTSAWGDFEGLIDDVAVWDTAVDLEQVTALYNGTSPVWLSGYQPLLGLDLESSLYGHNSSAYIRLPFSATQPESFDILKLQMQYDDAFVAYINGTEVARSGVTGPPQFNSTADVDRHDAAALLTDDFFIANAPGLLADGPNILAIQLLNASTTSPRALVRPTLTAIQSLADQSLITKGAAATGFIPVDNSWGTTWTGTSDFDDTSWISGTTAAGYDTGPEGPAGGPVAYWSFDTLTDGGTTAPDSMGHYDGMVSGATLTSGGLGRFGEALSFDGNNDSVMAGVIPELAAPAAFTTSAWFRRTVDRAGSGAETNHYVNNVLFAQSSDGANDNLEIGTEGDFLEIYLDTDQLGGAALPLRQQVPLQNDTWHHLVVTYDRHQANELKLYWDGLLVSQHTEYGGPVTPSETSPFSIGLARPGQNEWGDFEGLIDDVAIWNEALHSSQVTTLFQGTSPLMLSAFDDQIGLDLEAQLAEANSNTSAFVRIPFTVENPDEIVSLNLAMQFDDAFAAYINGSEVARSNVSGSLTWNSAADSDRPDEDALMAENFFIANQPGLLQSGTNILALQALSFDAERLLAFPQLTATMLPSRSFGFMETPTPKEAGTSTLTAIASPVTFSLPSNTFSEDFLLQLTTDEPDGEIRYTTNGDVPSEMSTLYTQPLEITESIQIRARVFRDAHIASETVTETYLRLSTGVQSFNSDLPIIVLDNLGAGNIPTYNPKQPVFMAIFEPDSSGRSSLTNTPEIATRAEFRSRGSSSQKAPKKSYRIETWSEKNDDRNISPFGMPSDSDWILHGPYFYDRALLRNDLIYELSNQIGRYAVRTQFVEVYVNSNGGELTNGDFMGLYSFMENIKRGKDRVDIQRLYPNATSEPEISGGHIVAIDALCWVQCGPSQTEVFFHSSRGLPSNDSYYVHNYPDKETITSAQRNWVENYFEEFEDALYGPNFNDPEIGYASLIDVDSFVDGHWLGQIAKNEDNLVHSTYFHIPRGEKMIMGPTWDYDQSMADSAEKPAEQDRKRPDEWHRFTNFDWWGRLFQDPDFEQKWTDRYQELRKDSFRPENIHSIIDIFADEIREAQQRNIQRWPGVQPQGGDWQIGEIDRLKQWYTDRIAWIDTQFAAQPIYSQPSGQVIVGQQLTITAPSGLVYYTTDGTDPRAPGGGISPSAILNSGPVTLNESTQLIARSYAGGEWSGPNEAIFAVGNPVELAITEINYNPADPSAGELLLDSNLDNDDFEFIEIQNIGSKTAKLLNHAFTNGIQFLFPNVQLLPGERGLIVNNRSAFQLRYGTGHNVLGEFDNTKLSNAGENLTLVDFTNNPLVDFSYNDNDPWPEAADGIGATLELIDPVNTPLDELGNPFHWRSSTEYGGTPGTSGLGQVGVIINEVLANTDAGMSDAIELLNTGSIPVDISGWFLSDSDDDLLKFSIPNRAPLEPGKWVIFDESDFNASAGIAPGDFALNGTFGEDVWLVMADASGNILSFIDEVHFPPSLVHESLGRHPNGSRELIPNQNITLGSANSSPRVGPVVISEVMYNPADPDDGSDPQQLEFVELYNPTSASVDLGNWELNGIGWTFPGGTRIGPGEFLTLVPFNPLFDAEKTARFAAVYHVDLQSSPGETGFGQFLGPYSGQLANQGERLTLYRAGDPPSDMPTEIPLVIEDQLDYSDQDPWPLSPDGNGDSLHRKRVDLWAAEPSSWETALPRPGAFGRVVHAMASNPAQTILAEVGNVLGVTHDSQVVQLSHSFTNPVVFTQTLTFAGTDPVAARVTNVQSDQFTVYLAEPSNLNGTHGVGETVSYLVVEAGNHILPGDVHLEVGSLSTDATVGKRLLNRWEPVNFTTQFDNAPVVISHIQTDHELGFFHTRQKQISSTGFQLALESEETLTIQPGSETVGYLAIDPGTGSWDDLTYEAFTTSENVGGSWGNLNFSQIFPTSPSFLSTLTGYKVHDSGQIRTQNISAANIQLKVEEDTTYDAEIVREQYESASYLALGGQGLLASPTTPLGQQTEPFSLVLDDEGLIGSVNVTVNISHTRTADLEVFLESPSGTMVELFTGVGGDGQHFSETVLDNQAAQSITSGTAPFTGYFQPTGSLAVLQGENINGTWTLHVTDTVANSDTGAFLNWSLYIDLASEVPANVNFDSKVDAGDIDLIFANFGSLYATYDLDRDSDTDQGDVDELVLNVIGTRYGDADLDHDVDFSDFRRLTTHFDPLARNPNNGWAQGNFNGDQSIDITDFNLLATNFAPLDLGAAITDSGNGSILSPQVNPMWATSSSSSRPAGDRSLTTHVSLVHETDTNAETQAATVDYILSRRADVSSSIVISTAPGNLANHSKNEPVVNGQHADSLARRAIEQAIADDSLWL